jgi:hypothetical protein
VTQNPVGVVSYTDARKKYPERRAGLRPSKKTSGTAFLHKNTPALTYDFHN